MASIHEGFVQIHPELKLPLNNFINPNKNLHTDHHLQQWHISLSISFWQHGDTRTSWTTLTYFISSIGKRIFLFFSLNLISDERMNHFSPFYSRLSSVQTFHQLLDFDRLLRTADGLAYVLFLSSFFFISAKIFLLLLKTTTFQYSLREVCEILLKFYLQIFPDRFVPFISYCSTKRLLEVWCRPWCCFYTYIAFSFMN